MTATQARSLGRLVREVREARGISYPQLAATMHVAVGWLHGVEAGRFLAPSMDRLVLLAEALHIEPAWISRITGDSIGRGLPEMDTYFRAKYDLRRNEIEKIKHYVEQLRRNDA